MNNNNKPTSRAKFSEHLDGGNEGTNSQVNKQIRQERVVRCA